MTKITKIKARQVLDSRGNPTLEVDVYAGKVMGRAIVPSGASTGIYEALELRDNSKSWMGKGVSKAVKNVSTIEKALKGFDVTQQKNLDQSMIELDGTQNKSKLGANAILGVSMAAARCHANLKNKPLYAVLGKQRVLPTPFANIINGGVHAGNKLQMQEFMIAPIKATSFTQATQMVSETYHILKDIIKQKHGKDAVNVGDEGGFAPPVDNAEQALELISSALEQSGYAKKMAIAMDAAASEFYDAKTKTYDVGKKLSGPELVDYYASLTKKYNIFSIEDPFDQDDFNNFKELTQKTKIQIVGDDLLVTNPARIAVAQRQKLCNALLLKVNQIGTLTEATEAATMAFKEKWNVMVSHRSGESEDPFIADLSVALGSGQIKLGAPCRSDRVAKYNQLLRIEEELGEKATYKRW